MDVFVAFSLFNVVTFRNGPCQSTMSLQGYFFYFSK